MKVLSGKTRSRTLEELDAYVEKAMQRMGGIGNNLGDVAEEYFYTGLQHKKLLNGIKYQFVNRNARKRGDWEWDIMLENGDTVTVIEVKHKLHPSDVESFAVSKLPHFKEAFPEYKNHTIYGGVAGLAVPSLSKTKAEEFGLTVLTQDGKNISILNSKGFKPRAY